MAKYYDDDVRNSKQKCIKDCISNESLRRHINVYVNYENITNNNKLLVFSSKYDRFTWWNCFVHACNGDYYFLAYNKFSIDSHLNNIWLQIDCNWFSIYRTKYNYCLYTTSREIGLGQLATFKHVCVCKIISILLITKRSMKIQMLVGIPKFSIKDGKRVLRPRKKWYIFKYYFTKIKSKD